MKTLLFLALLAGGYGVAHGLGASEAWAGGAGWAAALVLWMPLQKIAVAIAWHLRLGEAGKSRELYESLDDDARAQVNSMIGIE